MARAEIDFRIPAGFKDPVIVLTKCTHIGTKSFTLSYQMVNAKDINIIYAEAKTVIVMYNYETNSSIPVPESWRKALIDFEGTI